jgi:hypothetical protein
MILNIIHLNEDLFPDPEKKKALIGRRKSFENEIEQQGIKSYKVWDAIYNEKLPFVGCCRSHKQIVRDAKERGLNQVVIAEDDIRFTSPGAYKYFLDNIPESFDLYLGMSYSLIDYPNGVVNDYFDGLSIYAIHSRFFDEFLAINEFDHLDRQLSRMVDKKEFRIVDKYVCQQADGYSFIAKTDRSYGWRLKDKPLFQKKS